MLIVVQLQLNVHDVVAEINDWLVWPALLLDV